MLRDKSLIPLSRQHQHALALCVRIDRASLISDSALQTWQEEITRLFETEIKIHFAAEESVVFPVARRFKELSALTDELAAEHTLLRISFAAAEAQSMKATELSAFAERLAAHIRKEERQLFERMQELMGPAQFMALGVQLEEALKESSQSCALPPRTPDISTS